MSYQKQAWRDYDDTKTELQNLQNGAVVTPERMNHIETGIANSADKDEVTAQLAQTANKTEGFISVLDFIDIGETDNTTSIQNAIDYAENENEILVFPVDGVFQVSHLVSNGKLHIVGNGATIKQNEDSTVDDFFILNGDDSEIINLNLESNATRTSDGYSVNADNVLLETLVKGFNYSIDVKGDNCVVDATVYDSNYASCRLFANDTKPKRKKFTVKNLFSYDSRIKGFICNSVVGVEELIIENIHAKTNSTDNASDGIDVNGDGVVDRMIINKAFINGGNSNAGKFIPVKTLVIDEGIFRNSQSSYHARSSIRFYGEDSTLLGGNITIDGQLIIDGNAIIKNLTTEGDESPTSQRIALKTGGIVFQVDNLDARSLQNGNGVIRIDRENEHKVNIKNFMTTVQPFGIFKPTSAGTLFIGRTNYTGFLAGSAGNDRGVLVQPRIFYSDTMPLSSSWLAGDIVYKKTPTANGYIGWVCIETGTPGVWKEFGLIES